MAFYQGEKIGLVVGTMYLLGQLSISAICTRVVLVLLLSKGWLRVRNAGMKS